MRPLFFVSSILFLLLSCNSDDTQVLPEEPAVDYEGYTLQWADEFNAALNTANWTYELGDGTAYGLPPGWGNSELQLYTDAPANSSIQTDDAGNSALTITAFKDGDNYSSAKLTTQGLQSFRFGRVEARIKVPSGQGLWPAFWMLGDNIDVLDWPGCGEIDIMEVIGNQPTILHASAHFTNGENKLESTTASLNNTTSLADDYHIYRMDWTPTEMTFSLDDVVVQSTAIEADRKEFLRSFYLIFNVAVGGNWPGSPNANTVFPQQMAIDWVRVYSQDGFTAPTEPTLDIAEETIGIISSDLSRFAFNETLGQCPGCEIKAFGGGGEPNLFSSDFTIDGDSSLVFSYPGGGWGGAFFELDPTLDFTQYANGHLYFSISAPVELANIEVKLESVAAAVSLFIVDYTGTDLGNGFVEYKIPMTDFSELDLADLKIPFALWNPVNAAGEFFALDVILDNVYFE